jgi:iron complex outermembrane receptor protein
MRKCLYFGLFLLSLSFVSFSQSRSRILSGKVTDAKSGLPVPGVSVMIDDARIGVITDVNGSYIIRDMPSGHHLVEFSHTGYGTVVRHVDVKNDMELNASISTAILENQGVTVTGVSNATSIRKSPVPVIMVRKTELLQTPSTNIIDALSRQTGISQVSTGPAISKPVIRGLGFNRVVVINDGVRQEGQQWGEEHGLEMDEASISRAEILKGPASLTYGSDALAGVINLITHVPAPEGIIRGNVMANYQSNNRFYTTHASIGGNQQGFNWNAYGTLRSAGDYKNKYDGRVLNSRFNEKNYGGYIGLNKRWGYSHLIFSSFNQDLGVIEGDRDDATGKFLLYPESALERVATEKDSKSRKLQTPFQKINHHKFVLDNTFNIGESRLKINTAFQKNGRQELANPEDPDEAELFFDLKTITYNANWTLPEMKHWRTTIGFNGLYQQNTNKGEEAIIPDYHYNDAGVFLYAQGLYPKYTISGGLRFDRRSIRASELLEGTEPKFEAFTKDFSNLSGSAGVSYEASSSVTLKANIGTGFRAPNLAELASNGAHEGTNRYEYGSQNLESEKSVQLDAELDITNEHLTMSVNGFYNFINNFIFYRKLEGSGGGDSIIVQDGEELTAFQFNQNNARLYGFELSFDLHPHPLDWLHFQNKFSFVRGRFSDPISGTDNVPLIPAPRLMSELRADFDKAGKSFANLYVRLEADNNFRQNKPFTAYETETATAAYTLFNAGVGTDVQNRKKTLFSIHFAVINVTDKAYQNHLSRLKYTEVNELTGRRGVFNMGRNFSVKLNIPFSFMVK